MMLVSTTVLELLYIPEMVKMFVPAGASQN
jgi:hypothetical protein